jgi:hypothetical protein
VGLGAGDKVKTEDDMPEQLFDVLKRQKTTTPERAAYMTDYEAEEIREFLDFLADHFFTCVVKCKRGYIMCPEGNVPPQIEPVQDFADKKVLQIGEVSE